MKKILIYFEGLQKPIAPIGGTGRAIFNRAFELHKHHKDLHITMCGSNIGEFLQLDDNFILVHTPREQDREEFLKLFDVVIFCSTLADFSSTTKPIGQRWILDLHFWRPESIEIARIKDFDLICVRSELQKDFVKNKIDASVPIECVYNAVDCDMFTMNSSVQRIPNSLMFAGAVVPHKGVEKVIQTAVILSAYIPDITLNIYGSGMMWRHQEPYEDLLKRCSPPFVRFHGAIPYGDMPKAFAQNSVLILPSELESFGLVTVEAQACGCIPVVHNCGGTPETLEDGSTGILYTPNKYEAIVLAVNRALTFSEEQRNSARQFVKEKFAPKKLANEYYQLIVNDNLATVEPQARDTFRTSFTM